MSTKLNLNMLKPRVYRGWVNQPSTQQAGNKYHGMECIVEDYGGANVVAHFTQGECHGVELPRNAVSERFCSEAEKSPASRAYREDRRQQCYTFWTS